MSVNRSQIVDVTYDDPRTGETIRERRIQEVPPEDIEEVRNRELATFDRPRSPSREASRKREFHRRGYESDNQYDIDVVRRTRRTQRGLRRDSDWRRSQSNNDGPWTRRRDSHRYVDDRSDGDSSRERHFGERRRRRLSRDSDEDGARKREGNILERNFDRSQDGIVAGAAGAALGAMTARHFGGRENRGWKMLGGAVAGAAATNAAEKWYRSYSEERKEREERRERRERSGRRYERE